ncbi:MAG: caspase family protein [Magnetococcales bacterium]|nr:caspase family protein [Magnetococcales bacterium]
MRNDIEVKTVYSQLVRASLVWVLTALLWSSVSVAAEKRVALVIGNNDYNRVPRLEKAVNDAVTVGKELERFGFTVVMRKNASRREMNKAVGEFVEQLGSGDVAVLFYSGHGVQVRGTNYLLPVDIEAEKEQDLEDDAVELGGILSRVSQTKAKFSLAIIDACRDNPFRGKGRSIGSNKGLSVMSSPNGLMVIYSAGVNEQALDSLTGRDNDPNGLFTREFVKAMNEPGLRVDEMVRKVRVEVKKKALTVGHQQNPAIYDQTDGAFYFRPETDSPKAAMGGGTGPTQHDETIFWQSAKETPSGCGHYLEKFPSGLYVELAKLCLSKEQLRVQESKVNEGAWLRNTVETEALKKELEETRRRLSEEKAAAERATMQKAAEATILAEQKASMEKSLLEEKAAAERVRTEAILREKAIRESLGAVATGKVPSPREERSVVVAPSF